MLRYALRRVLWVFPSVIGVSLITFYVLSLLPTAAQATSEDSRRRRFEDLPLFFNLDPEDVRARATEAAMEVADAPPGEAEDAVRELVRLGGAALPVVLPQLDQLAPERRVRLALALAPLAERMRLDHREAARDPERVVVFWNRFWEARGVEFRDATARSAVRRYARYGTEARAEQLRALDTFALPHLFDELAPPAGMAEMPETRRLLAMIAHVTDSPTELAADATPEDAARAVERWTGWWMVYETDYIRLSGADRVAAFAVQTRYGKWAYEAFVLRLGYDLRGRRILDELVERAKVTITVVSFGVAVAYLLAMAFGSLSAWYRRRSVDRLLAALMLVPYAASPALLAAVCLYFGARAGLGWAVALLALALVADPARHQRAALTTLLTEDFVRAARARGVGRLTLVLRHGLPHTLLPLVTRSALELPVALTACFVLEAAFRLEGLGAVTVEAALGRDHRWLMALSLLGAAWGVISLVLADIGSAAFDPRLRDVLSPTRGGRA
jgi:ABC-type dipeptide/oligopeptide/nickel transport system permease component